MYLVNAYPKVCTIYVGQHDCTFGAVIFLLLLRSTGLDVLCVPAARLVLHLPATTVSMEVPTMSIDTTVGREVVEYTSSILTKK